MFPINKDNQMNEDNRKTEDDLYNEANHKKDDPKKEDCPLNEDAYTQGWYFPHEPTNFVRRKFSKSQEILKNMR